MRELFEGGTAVGSDDGQLLARFAADRADEAAFAALVARHGPMVWATTRAVLRHDQDAEDAFQATFLILARRAGSVRAGASLAPWLHRVAHRAAVAASREGRRRRERERVLLDRLPPSEAAAEPDLVATVRAEVARLAERERLPVVLCDLEGLTYAEAAARLGWPEPTLRGRLATARRRLKSRLARRGLAPAALPVGLLARVPVPASLARATVALGLGRVAPATIVLTLGSHLTRGIIMHHGKLIAAALLATTLGAVGYATARPGPHLQQATPNLPAPRPVPSGQPDAPPTESGTLRGRVVDPDGRPIAGAKVRTTLNFDNPEPPTVVLTGPDGRFELPAPSQFRQAGPMHPWRGVTAMAPGFGPGWTVDTKRPDATIRLVPPGPPVEGRLVGEDGRPVVGATVRVLNLSIPLDPAERVEANSLAAWLARPETATLEAGTLYLPHGAIATTDGDGRFAIADLGPERVAVLVARSPAIENTLIHAVTRAGEPITLSRRRHMELSRRLIQPARFEQVAWPTRPIAGTVTDASTGQPLAGWKIQGATSDSHTSYEFDVEAATDAAGRYSLTGLARARSYRIFLAPPPGQPYLPAGYTRVEASTGPEPVRLDHTARRGVVVRGRVADKLTGKPVVGYLNPEAMKSNPHVADFAGYAGSSLLYRYTDADGRFEVVVPPGPGLIAFRAREEARYRMGLGADRIPGMDPKFRHYLTVGDTIAPVNYHAIFAVDPAAGAEAVALDIPVESTDTIELTILDPEGRPLAGVDVEGAADFAWTMTRHFDSATVALTALAPGAARRVVVRHMGRKLVGSKEIRADDGAAQTLTLVPWGELRGRIINDDGTPRGDIALGAGPIRPTGPMPEPVGSWPPGGLVNHVRTDAEGRFHAVGLVLGHHYGISAVQHGEITVGNLVDAVVVAAGEVKDLGDLKVRPLPQE